MDTSTNNHDKELKPKDNLVVWFFYNLFNILRQISLFQQIRNIASWFYCKKYLRNHPDATHEDVIIQLKKTHFCFSYLFSDIWVLSNIVLGIVGCIVSGYCDSLWIRWLFVIYAIERTFEIFVYQVNVLLFDSIKARPEPYEIKSSTRMVLLLICNILEYILWFTIIYIFILRSSGDVANIREVFLDSFMTLSTNAKPKEFTNTMVTTIAYVEFTLGIFMNILCLARFISLLPSVNQKDAN